MKVSIRNTTVYACIYMNKYNKKKMLEAPPPFIFHTSFHTITHTISSSSLGQIRLVEPYLKGAYLPFCFRIHKINMYFYPLLFAYISMAHVYVNVHSKLGMCRNEHLYIIRDASKGKIVYVLTIWEAM